MPPRRSQAPNPDPAAGNTPPASPNRVQRLAGRVIDHYIHKETHEGRGLGAHAIEAQAATEPDPLRFKVVTPPPRGQTVLLTATGQIGDMYDKAQEKLTGNAVGPDPEPRRDVGRPPIAVRIANRIVPEGHKVEDRIAQRRRRALGPVLGVRNRYLDKRVTEAGLKDFEGEQDSRGRERFGADWTRAVLDPRNVIELRRAMLAFASQGDEIQAVATEKVIHDTGIFAATSGVVAAYLGITNKAWGAQKQGKLKEGDQSGLVGAPYQTVEKLSYLIKLSERDLKSMVDRTQEVNTEPMDRVRESLDPRSASYSPLDKGKVAAWRQQATVQNSLQKSGLEAAALKARAKDLGDRLEQAATLQEARQAADEARQAAQDEAEAKQNRRDAVSEATLAETALARQIAETAAQRSAEEDKRQAKKAKKAREQAEKDRKQTAATQDELLKAATAQTAATQALLDQIRSERAQGAGQQPAAAPNPNQANPTTPGNQPHIVVLREIAAKSEQPGQPSPQPATPQDQLSEYEKARNSEEPVDIDWTESNER